ncbi:hypothetical protein ACI797_15380 [Geodermatophilus sp. SYSU D00691]
MEEAPSVLSEFVSAELKTERERRATLDQRGITIVASSSTLVTLLSGLAAFVALGDGDPKASIATFSTFCLTLAGFATAAFFGLWTNRSYGYQVLHEESLLRFRDEEMWGKSGDEARWLLYRVNVTTLETIRKGNERKSRLVNRGLLAQLIALLLLVATVLVGAGNVLF